MTWRGGPHAPFAYRPERALFVLYGAVKHPMACSPLERGFDVAVKAPPRQVALFVLELQNLPMWDPGCAEAVPIDAYNYFIYDKSFQQRVWYTIKHQTSDTLRVVGRGRGFCTRETIVVRPHEHTPEWCHVAYTVSVSLRMPYCLCSPCVDGKLARASGEAGRSLQELYAHHGGDARESEELMFDCEL